jgi:ABC-2 type transport system permease protein
LIHGPELLAQLLFTPLLAALSIWIGVAISMSVNDVRTAQSLGVAATIPLALATSLIAFAVIPMTLGPAIGLGAGLVFVDALGWRLLGAGFNRERLITGTK